MSAPENTVDYRAGEFQPLDRLVTILRHRGLVIADVDEAKHYLATVGHYRLSDYYPAFTTEPKQFDGTVSAADVYSLYSFDRRLRLLIFGPLEKIEVALRALIIKECGDFLSKGRKSVFINIFDEELYDLSSPQNRDSFKEVRKHCIRGARARWRHLNRTWVRPPDGGFQTVLKGEFNSDSLMAWEMLQTTSLNPLLWLFRLLRKEIRDGIANHFGLPRDTMRSVLFGLRDLRNACAHHEPIWNWDANYRSRIMRFPRAYVVPAMMDEGGRRKLYAYCAAIHILLSYLSNGRSTWYRRLKKLINEFNTIYGPAMGFPDSWQNLPFWCTADVRRAEIVDKLQRRVARNYRSSYQELAFPKALKS